MSLPLGYYTKGDKRVCKLLKSLYGLKQASRKWNAKLCSFLLDFGFVQSINDFSLFFRSVNNIVVVLLVYVDDIILTDNNLDEINKVKDLLTSKFLVKDLGKLRIFLGIEVTNVDKGIFLSQSKYRLKLLNEFGMLGCKPVKTPLDINVVIKVDGVDNFDNLLTNVTYFQKLIGNQFI